MQSTSNNGSEMVTAVKSEPYGVCLRGILCPIIQGFRSIPRISAVINSDGIENTGWFNLMPCYYIKENHKVIYSR